MPEPDVDITGCVNCRSTRLQDWDREIGTLTCGHRVCNACQLRINILQDGNSNCLKCRAITRIFEVHEDKVIQNASRTIQHLRQKEIGLSTELTAAKLEVQKKAFELTVANVSLKEAQNENKLVERLNDELVDFNQSLGKELKFARKKDYMLFSCGDCQQSLPPKQLFFCSNDSCGLKPNPSMSINVECIKNIVRDAVCGNCAITHFVNHAIDVEEAVPKAMELYVNRLIEYIGKAIDEMFSIDYQGLEEPFAIFQKTLREKCDKEVIYDYLKKSSSFEDFISRAKKIVTTFRRIARETRMIVVGICKYHREIPKYAFFDVPATNTILLRRREIPLIQISKERKRSLKRLIAANFEMRIDDDEPSTSRQTKQSCSWPRK